MAAQKEILPVAFDQDFVISELDRLINSAKLRVKQQRIHIQELAGNIAERTRASHDLKTMIAGQSVSSARRARAPERLEGRSALHFYHYPGDQAYLVG